MNNYLVGQVVKLSVTIKNAAGVAADPGALRLKIKAPSGAVTTLTHGVDVALVKDSVGNYHADQLLNAPGVWAWRWESDAPNAGASEGTLTVKKSAVI